MKNNILAFLGLCLLVSCNESGSSSRPDSVRDPVCSEEVNCLMNWNILADRINFPRNLELIINDKLVLNECDRNPQVVVNRTSNSFAEVVIWDYTPLNSDLSSIVKILMNDLGNCYEEKTIFYHSNKQAYKIHQVNNKSHVLINLTK